MRSAGDHHSRLGWLRAVGAIFRKDVRVFLRYPLNAVMRVIEPVLWIMPAILLSRAFQVDSVNTGFAGVAGTSDYVGFIVVGGVISAYLSSVFWGMGFALKNEMDIGVLESNWLTPVPPVVQLLGRSLFALAHTTLNTLIIGFVIYAGFGFSLTGRVTPVILTLVPLLTGLYGLGIGLAAVVLVTNNAQVFIDIANQLLTVLGGSAFPVTVLPRPLLAISLALPLTYAYDALRGQLLGTRTLLAIPKEQAILVLLAVACVIPGYLIFKSVDRRCRELGTLARH